ncbi:unnamed protein product [Urochloa humidicola]
MDPSPAPSSLRSRSLSPPFPVRRHRPPSPPPEFPTRHRLSATPPTARRRGSYYYSLECSDDASALYHRRRGEAVTVPLPLPQGAGGEVLPHPLAAVTPVASASRSLPESSDPPSALHHRRLGEAVPLPLQRGALPRIASSRQELRLPLNPSTRTRTSLTPQELGMAALVMWFRSIVLFIFAVFVVYSEHSRPVILASEIAGILCLFLHFWSVHITQFWLRRPYGEDLSVIMLLCCFAIFMIAFLVGAASSPVAGMCITCLAAMCMAILLIGCIREYNHTRFRQDPVQPHDFGLHITLHTEETVTVDAIPQKHGRRHIERRRAAVSHLPAANVSSVKPAWK